MLLPLQALASNSLPRTITSMHIEHIPFAGALPGATAQSEATESGFGRAWAAAGQPSPGGSAQQQQGAAAQQQQQQGVDGGSAQAGQGSAGSASPSLLVADDRGGFALLQLPPASTCPCRCGSCKQKDWAQLAPRAFRNRRARCCAVCLPFDPSCGQVALRWESGV